MRRSLWPFALALLLVLDAVLVVWAMRPSGSSAAQETTPSMTSSTTSSSGSTSSPASPADRVLVVAQDSQRAWRVVTGSSCSGTVNLTHSADAGATWKPGPKVPLKAVFSATSNDAGNVVLTGLDASCKPATVEVKESSAEVTTAVPQWAVNPAEPGTLLHGGKATAKACPTGAVHDLASDSDLRANVLCDGGVIRRTVDGGTTFSNVETVKGATGIATASAAQGFRVYVASSQACGVRVTALADQSAGTGSGCLPNSSGVKGTDITIWGRSIWAASADKGWVISTGTAAATSTSASSTSSDSSSSSSSQAMSTSSSSRWVPPSTTRTYTPPATSTQSSTTAAPTDTGSSATSPSSS